MNDQVNPLETAKILEIAGSQVGLPGDFVELGCYKGETSVLLGKLLRGKDKTLWLYDSFAGLPEKSTADASSAGDAFRGGELVATKNEVVLKFKKAGLRVPRIRKGFFEELRDEDLPGQIAFAFLDGDLYQSIKTSFCLVADKIVDEGVIIVHDYNNPQLPGAAKAVDEFIRANPQYLFERIYSLAVLRKSAHRRRF